MKLLIKNCRIVLIYYLVFHLMCPAMLFAQQATIPGLYQTIVTDLPEVPSNQLPENWTIIEGVSQVSQSGNKQVVSQNKEKAVIDWESFNIGKEAWQHFDQQGHTDWAVLNRIYDENPSMIFGRLTADGSIFLINQNGILFGPGSQVNVHALTASSLDLDPDDFIANTLHFTGDDSRGPVSNHGDIQTGTGGHVYLMAPEVENYGSIDAPAGQVALAAGNDVTIETLEGVTYRTFPFIYVQPGEKGNAVNAASGKISADQGIAGMYGRNVNQNGYIRSVTAVTNNGRIELHASDRVTTGANSATETPVTDNPEKVHASFGLDGGEIHVGGLDRKIVINEQDVNETTATSVIEHNGRMAAPSGNIAMEAEERIYLSEGSELDVSGLWVATEAASSAVDVQLNSVELKNDFNQKNGILQGETITVQKQEGAGIGDVSAHLSGEFLTAREMATQGGEITLRVPDGDIIVRGAVNGEESAVIDFSGGGTIVSDGHINTTKLISGNRVYDISDAPNSLKYDGIANYQVFTNQKSGTREVYTGLYMGGANSLYDLNTGYIEGADAGQLNLIARGIVLDGILDGSVIAGRYQTMTVVPEVYYDNFALQTASGVKAPRGGELIIGKENPYLTGTQDGDYFIEEVVISGDAPLLPDDFSSASDLKTTVVDGTTPYTSDIQDESGYLYRTVLSDRIINQAELSNLVIHANTKITTLPDAEITLKPGGLRIDDSVDYITGMPVQYIDIAPAEIDFKARSIELNGALKAPGGDVRLTLVDTVTSPKSNNSEDRYVDILNERAFLAGGSCIQTNGEVISNLLAGISKPVTHGYIDGGHISVLDGTNSGSEVIVADNAILDVSAGYEITSSGRIAPGAAGGLKLKGDVLVVEGDLRGYSLNGTSGGEITLHAGAVNVGKDATVLPEGFTADDALPDELLQTFTLGENQLAETGFTHLSLLSYEDLYFSQGTKLMPSTVKMAVNTSGTGPEDGKSVFSPAKNLNLSESQIVNGDGLEEGFIYVPISYLGGSSIIAKAGQSVISGQSADKTFDTYGIHLEEGAAIEVAPKGRVELSGLVADISGNVIAPGGTVKISTTGVNRDLTLHESSAIMAGGINRPEIDSYIPETGYIYDAIDGGSVTLSAKSGNIVMQAGALIDISGSTPEKSIVYHQNGSIDLKTVSSNAGSLELVYLNDITINGGIIGKSFIETSHGASLILSNANESNGFIIDQSTIRQYADWGFDAMSFSSLKQILLSGDMDIALARGFSLDAPLITGDGDNRVHVSAPQVALNNMRAKYGDEMEEISYAGLVSDETLAMGETGTVLAIDGEFIDLKGSIAVEGFEQVSLQAEGDMRLTDEVYYDNTGALLWQGLLRTPGDLTVGASRIYPTTRSDFTLASDNGRITTLPGQMGIDRPIVSAGGSLTLAAKEIDHRGYVAAPMGTIRFTGPLSDENDSADTIFLAENSVVSVASDSNVAFGELDDVFWYVTEKPKTLTPKINIQDIAVTDVPERGVDIQGTTVVMQTDAKIDISGGGTIFAAEFLPGAEGLANPLTLADTYVVVPGIFGQGETVYLNEGNGLAAGNYSLLPEEYAFLDGAYVVQYIGSANTPGGPPTFSSQGYPVVTGYEIQTGTGFVSAVPSLFSVRKAEDVFAQGNFNVKQMISGDGGELAVEGATTILEGELVSNALEGYKGGILRFSGRNTSVVQAASSLGSEFGFSNIQEVVGDLENTAQILDTTISNSGLGELYLGTLDGNEVTQSVVIEENTGINVPKVEISALNNITLKENSTITASGTGGEVIFNTPDGNLIAQSYSSVSADEKIQINAGSARFNGVMNLDGASGTLAISTDSLFVVGDAYTGDVTDGLYLKGSLAGFSGVFQLDLQAEQDVTFVGDTRLEVQDTLTIDTPTIAGIALDGNQRAEILSGNISIMNSGESSVDTSLSDTGDLVAAASNNIIIGHGDIYLDGFGQAGFSAENSILLAGDGSLTVAKDASFSAGRIAAAGYSDAQVEFETAHFQITAGDETNGWGDIGFTAANSGNLYEDRYAGGSIDIVGNSIQMDNSRIDTAGGWLSMTAKGADAGGYGITLENGAGIDVSGNNVASAGRVSLLAETGSVYVDQNSMINVSAGSEGDAGVLSLAAPDGEVLVDGTIAGNASNGAGGTFLLDAGSVADTAALISHAAQGGFDKKIDLRFRTGSFQLLEEDLITAQEVKLSIDSGEAVIDGTINASGTNGGLVEINSRGNLVLSSTAVIDASSSVSTGESGQVSLYSVDSRLTMEDGALINVSTENGSGGVVNLKAGRNAANDDLQMDLRGTIQGASKVTAEGVRTYEDSTINSSDIASYHNDADAFMSHAQDIRDRLILTQGLNIVDGPATDITITPGISVYSTGDLTLASLWDISQRGRSDQGGTITLRAAGDLNMNQSLVDHPTVSGFSDLSNLNDEVTALPDSWQINLVAGSDLSGADVLAVQAGQGDLNIGDQQVVFTENNTLSFASGRDTIVNGAPGLYSHIYMVNEAMKYNLATFSGDIYGNVGRDLVIMNNAAVQSATGDIRIAVKRDLHIELNESTGSAIRTTGTAPPDAATGGYDWNYAYAHDGGDIRLDVGGKLRMGDVQVSAIAASTPQNDLLPFYRDNNNQLTPHLKYWDNMYLTTQPDYSSTYEWSADYGRSFVTSTPTAGIATMGGGSVRVTTGASLSGQIGTFKDGELAITVNGDTSGFFQAGSGDAAISSMGNITSPYRDASNPVYAYATSMALFQGSAEITATGNVDIGSIFNPTFVQTYAEYASTQPPTRFLSYDEDQQLSISSINGSLSLSGGLWEGSRLSVSESRAYRVLPASVNLSAGKDILLGSVQGGEFLLAPSPTGNLSIYAGKTLNGLHENFKGDLLRACLRMSDLAPDSVYRLEDVEDDPVDRLFADETREDTHAGFTPLHKEDDTPITVYAGEDIREISFITAKQTIISAGKDIAGMYFFGQNLGKSDTTLIRAGGDMDMYSAALPALADTGFRNAGPGLFVVQAGGSMDLGTTQGIQNVGNAFYSALSEENSALAVIAGYGMEKTALDLFGFFDALIQYGRDYSDKLAEGDLYAARKIVDQATSEVVDPFFSDAEKGDGNINMTSSSIQTSAEMAELYIIANGDMNVGLTTIPDPAEVASGEYVQTDTGIFTTRGGGINIFSYGDLNVNESRVMTYRGGDIAVWTHDGDINAGRGSKTAVNTGSPRVVSVYDDEGNIIAKKIVWEAPSVGSGIRTLTYDPDGFQGPEEAPLAGNAYLFAPNGIIDAGEAGIAGQNVILGATKVLNAQNIDVAGLSVGVPQASTGPSMGTLVGAGTVSETAKMAEESAAMKSAEDRFASRVAQLADQLVPKWIAVEVIGFDKPSEKDQKGEEKQ